MKLCSHVKDKCCTLVDEMKIQKLWTFKTEPLLSAYYDQIIINVDRVMRMYD